MNSEFEALKNEIRRSLEIMTIPDMPSVQATINDQDAKVPWIPTPGLSPKLGHLLGEESKAEIPPGDAKFPWNLTPGLTPKGEADILRGLNDSLRQDLACMTERANLRLQRITELLRESYKLEADHSRLSDEYDALLADHEALEAVALCAMRYVKAQSGRYQRELLEAIDNLERVRAERSTGGEDGSP